MTKLEEVARAICKCELSDPKNYGDEICCQFAPASRRREGGHNLPDMEGPLRCLWENFSEAARAALEAMKGPTKEMADAPDVFRQNELGGHFDILKPEHYIQVFNAMIDAALEGK